MASVVVTLDGSVRAPDAPLLYADDLGAVRGDGCFETALVRDGAPLKGRAHLDRLGRSAAALGLPAPNDGAWWAAMQRAAMLYGEEAGSAEGALRLVYTRGRESDPGTPTAYVTVSPLPDRARRARTEGISAITLNRGYSTGLGTDAPWLLLGHRDGAGVVAEHQGRGGEARQGAQRRPECRARAPEEMRRRVARPLGRRQGRAGTEMPAILQQVRQAPEADEGLRGSGRARASAGGRHRVRGRAAPFADRQGT